MSEEPLRLRMGHCGHWLPADHPPAGVTDDMHGQPILLCDECLAKVRAHQRPKVETKEIRPGDADVMTEAADARAEGRRIAQAEGPRRVPEGIHPRSSWAREFLAGYDETKGAAEG